MLLIAVNLCFFNFVCTANYFLHSVTVAAAAREDTHVTPFFHFFNLFEHFFYLEISTTCLLNGYMNQSQAGIPPHGIEGVLTCHENPPRGFPSVGFVPLAAKLGQLHVV